MIGINCSNSVLMMELTLLSLLQWQTAPADTVECDNNLVVQCCRYSRGVLMLCRQFESLHFFLMVMGVRCDWGEEDRLLHKVEAHGSDRRFKGFK